MYFTPEELHTLGAAYGLSGSQRYLEASAEEIGETLVQRPSFYRQFGIYWWSIKRMLKRYYRPTDRAGADLWFLGQYRDRALEQRALVRTDAGRADLRRTWLAGLLYMRINTSFTRYAVGRELEEHIYEDPAGHARFFRLADEDLTVQLDLFPQDEAESSVPEQGVLDLDGDICVFVPGTWYNHGNRCLEQGRHHEAVSCFRKYIALARTDQERSQGWLSAGVAYDGAGHFAKAIACYRRCYAIEGQPWVLENIATAYEHMGDLRIARRYYEEALSGMPGNPVIAHSLQSVSERLGSAGNE